LNFSQAFNPFGAILGVLIGTVFIFSGIEHDPSKVEAMKHAGTYATYLESETMRVVRPYMVLGVVVFLWAILIMRTKFPKITSEERVSENTGKVRELSKKRHFLLGVLAQFCYVGAQVGTWSFFIQYAQDYTGIAEKSAGYFLTGTLVAFLIGRFSATVIMKYIKPGKLMGIYAIMNLLLVGLAVMNPGWIGVWSSFQFLHVINVSDNICTWNKRSRSEYKNCRFDHCYGYHRRRCIYTFNGSGSRKKHGICNAYPYGLLLFY
jgi:FHS family L-fucose permease-like MFS transporter